MVEGVVGLRRVLGESDEGLGGEASGNEIHKQYIHTNMVSPRGTGGGGGKRGEATTKMKASLFSFNSLLVSMMKAWFELF